VQVRRPSVSIAISCIALVVDTAGTSIAAAPIVKRALYADNAGKLGGKTLRQVIASPGPASSAGALISIRTATATLASQEQRALTVRCAAGERILAGGWTSEAPLLGTNSRPTGSDVWEVGLVNLVSEQANVTLYATCVR